jgi:signal transduction histidine kinase
VNIDLRFKKVDDICREFGIVSQILVITAFDGKINGGLFVQQSTPRNWTTEEIELIEMIAEQFSVAVDRSFSISKVIVSNQTLLEKTLELKKTLKQEKEMRQMQNDFVAIVSHEFKTPLQVIDSTRELLLRKLRAHGIVDESIDKCLLKIKSGVVRMNGLIQSTLNLSKMEMDNGDIAVNKQDFNIVASINEIIERNRTLAIDKSIEIKVDISAFPQVYNGDQKLLDHCFSNVISNAIKYSRNNTVVTINGFIDDKNLTLKVIDSGIGIPKEDIQNIGKKFFRAKNTLSVSGTGIGLYLTKYFVELHNGSVLIESELNIGTTISVMLPIKSNTNSKRNGGSERRSIPNGDHRTATAPKYKRSFFRIFISYSKVRR